ncbi:hypothetical protein LRR18_16510 [Mangrovimonas sp. AS39]|uniref:hypothetical protein n=1 Tax=Mangrovimonas futianensis TaxID=2895523 RepID=UPI001E373875|nr:hypothetical protein [Mangrovimonas futianensis]MCF1193193.1 hypothetical protein [Mangrovimonas futianensis]
MSCFYEMDELGIPLTHEIVEKEDWKQKFYTMRVCKECRASWMAMIKFWFDLRETKQQSTGSGIYVRELGATIEISEEDWYKRNPGIEPVRFKADD